MTIGDTIRSLLEERKRVILPGFGNLEVIDPAGDTPSPGESLSPPGPAVRFDSTYSNDDGLLTEAWSGYSGTGREEAGQQVLELVDAIRFALDKGESYMLEGVGTFSRDEDGKVRFRKDPDWILDPDQFGLEPVDLLELDEEDEGEAPPVLPEPEPESSGPQPEASETEAEAAPSVRKAEPVSPPPEKPAPPPVKRASPATPPSTEPWKRVDKSSRRVRIWRVIWITAGVLIVVLAGLLLIPADRLGFIRGGQDDPVRESPEMEQGPLPSGGEVTGAGTESMDEQETADEQEAPVERQPVTEQAPPEESAATKTHDFYLIAGSFRKLANASELQDKLKARGYDAEVMMTENRMYRVSLASYATQEEAERALAGVKAEPGLESAWLLSNR